MPGFEGGVELRYRMIPIIVFYLFVVDPDGISGPQRQVLCFCAVGELFPIDPFYFRAILVGTSCYAQNQQLESTMERVP